MYAGSGQSLTQSAILSPFMVLIPLGSTPSSQDVGVSFTDAGTGSMWYSNFKPCVGLNCWKVEAEMLEGALIYF